MSVTFDPKFIPMAINAASAGVLANRFAQMSLKGGLLFGACAEVSSLVARFVVSFFSDDGAIARTASRIARVLGGHYLGNMALQAAGFAPLAFGPATVLIPWAAPVLVPLAISTISDLWEATLGNLVPSSD